MKDRYDSIEHEYLDEIDRQVRRYTRATTQKLENLTNRDHNVRGNLNYLLTLLGRNHRASELVEQIQPVFQFYEQSFLSEKSLWHRKRPGKRAKAAPVLIEDQELDAGVEAQAGELLRTEYNRSAVSRYVEQWLGERGICYSKDLVLSDDKAYIMSMLAVLTGQDPEAGYLVRDLVGHGIGTSLHEDPEIPNFVQRKRGTRLQKGMTLAIEPMINEGTCDVWWMDDDWTVVTRDGKLSAHYENTIVITDDGCEILTMLPEEE